MLGWRKGYHIATLVILFGATWIMESFKAGPIYILLFGPAIFLILIFAGNKWDFFIIAYTLIALGIYLYYFEKCKINVEVERGILIILFGFILLSIEILDIPPKKRKLKDYKSRLDKILNAKDNSTNEKRNS